MESLQDFMYVVALPWGFTYLMPECFVNGQTHIRVQVCKKAIPLEKGLYESVVPSHVYPFLIGE